MEAELPNIATSPASTNKRSRVEFEGETAVTADVKVTPPKHCNTCDKPGHNSRTCPDQICEGCNAQGHSQHKCPTNPLPKAKRVKLPSEVVIDHRSLSESCLEEMHPDQIREVISKQLSGTSADLAAFISNTTSKSTVSANDAIVDWILNTRSTTVVTAQLINSGGLNNVQIARLMRSDPALAAHIPEKLAAVVKALVDDETDKSKLLVMATVAFTTTSSPAPIRPHHCGNCHREGHNQRKCPLNKDRVAAVAPGSTVLSENSSDVSDEEGDIPHTIDFVSVH